MQPLNERVLSSLLKILAEEDVDSPSEPALLTYPHGVVFTDGGLLLEWGNHLIEQHEELYEKLRNAGLHDEQMRNLRESKHWIDALIRGQKFHPVQEAEPDGDTKFTGCMDFICRTRRCHYRIGYIIAVEETVGTDNLNYRCHIPPDHEDLVLLCVFEADKLVGAVANEV